MFFSLVGDSSLSDILLGHFIVKILAVNNMFFGLDPVKLWSLITIL